MKHILVCLFLLLNIYPSHSNTSHKVLFELGQKDSSASDFSLYPNHYKIFLANFGGEKAFFVGYSTAEKHWPYVLPGPLDGWAGGGYWGG